MLNINNIGVFKKFNNIWGIKMYKVHNKTFKTFNQVVEYVWDNFKIGLSTRLDSLSEMGKQDACREIDHFLRTIDDDNIDLVSDVLYYPDLFC